MSETYSERMARKVRAKRAARHPDTRTVPGYITPTDMRPHGSSEAAQPTKRERKVMRAWDNQGGTGHTVEWRGSRTRLRKMAPSGAWNDGPCPNVGAVVGGEARPDRYPQHGARQDTRTWESRARTSTERRAFNWDVNSWGRD